MTVTEALAWMDAAERVHNLQRSRQARFARNGDMTTARTYADLAERAGKRYHEYAEAILAQTTLEPRWDCPMFLDDLLAEANGQPAPKDIR